MFFGRQQKIGKIFPKVLMALVFLFLFNIFVANQTKALDGAIESAGVTDSAMFAGGAEGVLAKCKALIAKANGIACIPKPAGTSSYLDCQLRDKALAEAEAQCKKDAAEYGATDEVSKLVKTSALKDKAREALAFAFKTSLKMFTRQIAHDTAVWVASGGRGQKPLFITEGWGAYVQNAADNALGNFIDGIGQSFGVDLCQPDFRVKLLIQTSLNYNRTTKARCSLTKIVNNWESAISSASFSVDYRNSMRPGENDISFYLQMADQRNSYVADAKAKAAKEAEIPGLWTDIKNVAGKILTPGTMIADTFRDKTADSNTTLGWSTFTNTAADMVEEFLNTLVAQLLTNLQAGVFANSSSGGGTGSRTNWGDLLTGAFDALEGLFNYSSSPLITGTRGAQEKFLSLIINREKVGNKFDLLVSLTKCAEADKVNPGPTDCVIDSAFAEQIKNKAYVKDLPETILSRTFSPIINQTNSLETEIPYRSILILRKYRIVPVGWEQAATLIKEDKIFMAGGVTPLKKNWTLKEVMDCYYGAGINGCLTDDLKGMVDPHWLLKAYEAFCRRQGFGEQNQDFGSLDGSINRAEYCADEQQCLFDDSKGNCSAYGYCAEERRLWDLGASCDVRNNTCQTYKARSGNSVSLLDNTLNFSNCGSGNVGCRSYATDFNLAGLTWNGEFIDGNEMKIYEPSAGGETLAIGAGPEWRVDEYKNVSRNKRLKISKACSQEVCANPASNCSFSITPDSTGSRYCDFSINSNNSCQVAPGGVACFVEACYRDENKLSSFNSGFESTVGGTAFDAAQWTDENSYLNDNNRHLRTTTQKKDGSASLQILGAAGLTEIKTTLDNITVAKNTNYIVRFWAQGYVNTGSVNIYATNGVGDSVDNLISSGRSFLGSYGGKWKQYSFQFSSGDNEKISLIIKSTAGTVANFYLDEFKLSEMTTECKNSVSARLFTGLTGVTANKNNIYLDRDAAACASGDDGCSMFLRNKAGVGGNLIYNGGFEHGMDGWGLVTNNIGGALVTNANADDLGRSIGIDEGDYYVLSLDAGQETAGAGKTLVGEMRFPAGSDYLAVADTNCSKSADGKTVSLEFTPNASGNNYERRFCWFRAPQNSEIVTFRPYVKESDGRVNLDNVKLEKVTLLELNTATVTDFPYSQYEGSARPTNQVAYLKKGPDYFGCYKTAAGLWPKNVFELNAVLANQDPMCSTYAPVCLKSEVGCEAYTPADGDPTVPGVVDNLDLCPSECVGYQVYKQEATNFVSSAYKQFIADKNAKYCSAAYAGCDEFTNLDELGQGAEKKEYYVDFRACQKPAIDDGIYYTWEGSDITGYQLKSFTLKRSNVDTAPCTNLEYFNWDGAGERGTADTAIAGTAGQNYCDDSGDISGVCAQADMVSNSDCREFYDVGGNITYRLLSKTISVSDNCHPYRRTRTQTTADLARVDCSASHGYFNTNAECIYMAIPGEGKTCSAATKGCRAYTGNRGNNVREAFTAYDFNSGTTTDIFWVGGNDTKDGLTISYESTFPGGNSLTNKADTNNTIKHQVGIRKNKSYTISFWAKADSQSFYLENLKFNSAPSSDDYFTHSRIAGETLVKDRVLIKTDWNYYELGPVFVTWDPSTNPDNPDYLVFELPGGQKIYLDNIVLKEVTNNVFAIENSWYTPVSCDNKLDDPDGTKSVAAETCQETASGRCFAGEMLGCSAYTDRFKNKWSLRSFSSLCRAEAVGCESLIDTFNSDSPAAADYNVGDDLSAVGSQDVDKVTVPADQTIYMVNRSEFACRSANKGCQAVGLPVVDKWDDTLGYQTVFLKNDPDRYATDLCKHSELWCEQFTNIDSTKYFKDPHGKYCQYGQPKAGSSVGWYIAGTELACQATTNQSLGTGYEPANVKSQPIGLVNNVTGAINNDYDGWAGTCSESQSGCSEYVDPLTYTYTNQILSRQCLDNVGNRIATCRNVKLKANTLYNYKLGDGGSLSFSSTDCPQPITTIGDNPLLGGKFFYIDAPDQIDCTYTITKSGEPFNFAKDVRNDGDKVVIAGVYYALKNSVDRTSCSGVVDFNSSCVLFNERSDIDQSAVPTGAADTATLAKRFSSYLNYDAVATFAANMPAGTATSKAVDPIFTATGGDSNLVLKASPNRTCKTWLSCVTYEKTNSSDKNPYFAINDRCLETKACDYLDENGQCGNYPSMENIDTGETAINGNMTGFVNPFFKPFSEMKQIGESTEVVNGNFESAFGSTVQPLGWGLGTFSCNSVNDCGVGYPVTSNVVPWRKEFFSLDRSNSVAYEGTGYLSLKGGSLAYSEPIDFEVATSDETAEAKYTLTAYAKTTNLGGQGDPNNPDANRHYPWTEMRLRFLDASGNDLSISSIATLDAAGKDIGPLSLSQNRNWYYDNIGRFKVYAGRDWTQIRLGFKLPTGTKSIQLALMNINPDQEKGIDNTKLSGYSLWDNIAIKPVLNNIAPVYNGSDQLISDGSQIDRSCRIYPSASAASCKYSDTDSRYNGQYGYCLLKDPNNKKQCLQWWPIDAIKGEAFSDYASFYTERFPLYYCIEKKNHKIDSDSLISQTGSWEEIGYHGGDSLGINYGQDVSDLKNISARQIKIDSNWASFFRYPFVYKFIFSGTMLNAGIRDDHYPVVEFNLFNVAMYPKKMCFAFLGVDFGNIPVLGGISNFISGFLSEKLDLKNLEEGRICYVPVGNATDNPFFNSITGVIGSIGDFVSGSLIQVIITIIAGVVGEDDIAAVINTVGILFKGWGQIVGSGTNMQDSDSWGGWGTFGMIFPITLTTEDKDWDDGYTGTSIHLEYPWHSLMSAKNSLSSLISVFDTAGSALQEINYLLGYIFFYQGGMKIITDQDSEYAGSFTDPDPARKGNILGYVSYWDVGTRGAADPSGGYVNISGTLKSNMSLEYCSKIVRVVNSAGNNRAWASRLSTGATYKTNDADCILDTEDKGEPIVNGLGDILGYIPRRSEAYTSSEGKGCFYASDYCLSGADPGLCDETLNKNHIGQYSFGADFDQLPLDPDYVGGRRLRCETYNGYNDVRSCGNNSCTDYFINKNYFCNDDQMFRKIYSYNGYNYLTTDYKPYGSIVAPNNAQDPAEWDSRVGNLGRQPLFYETPVGSVAPFQARMGQVHSIDNLKQLFAKSYGVWEWTMDDPDDDIISSFGYYKPVTGTDWSLPTKYCSGSTRPTGNNCKIRPRFDGGTPRLADQSMYVINGANPVKMEFSVVVDTEQAPIKFYEVNWADGNLSSYSGISMLNRPASALPLTLYHYYDYYSVLNSCLTQTENCRCFTDVDEPYCEVRPKVTVSDNWGATATADLLYNNLSAWITIKKEQN